MTYICDHCQKYGLFSETHNLCEIHYINNGRQTDCQCDNIGHGRNVRQDDKPVTKEEYKSYISDSDVFVKVNHSDIQRIDLVTNALIKKYNFVTATHTEMIYLFTGKIYENQKALSIIKEETENRIINCTTSDTNEVISKIKRKTFKDLEDFDSDSYLLTVENGILHLDTLELEPHTPANLSKILIPRAFTMPKFDDIEDNLKDTMFWTYLKRSFTVKGKFMKEDFENVLEVMASVFIKHNIDEKSVIFLGNGENGKSVLLDYLSSLIGKNNISHIPLQVLSEDKFASANLDGKLANIFADLEKNELKKSNVIKTISSGESIYVQHKGKTGFDLYPICKLIFSTNKFPKVFDQSQGFFRRWIIVMWNRNFANDPDRIDNLKDILIENQEEKNLVFSSLMKLTGELKIKNKFTHTKDWKIVQKLWNQNADPVSDFIDNYLIDSLGSKTKRETYQFYKETMFDTGEIPLGSRQFSNALAEYYEDSKNDGNRIWLNIDFKRPKQETLTGHY